MITGFSLNCTDETSLIKNFITFPHLACLSVVLHFTLLKGRRRSSQLPLLYTTKANFEDAEDAATLLLLLPPLPGNAQKRAAPILHGGRDSSDSADPRIDSSLSGPRGKERVL